MNDTSPVFRPLLAHAWRASLQYPWLLFFGFFASFLGLGGFWELLFNTQNTEGAATFMAVVQAIITGNGNTFVRGIAEASRAAPGTIALTALLFLLLLGILVGLLALAALASATLIDTAHKTALQHRTTFRAAWAVGRRFIYKILGVHLMMKAGVAVLFLFAGLLFNATFAMRGVFFFIDFLLFIGIVAIALGVSLLTMYAVSYIVLRGFMMREAFVTATRLFLRHWLVSLECASLFFVLSFATGVAALGIIIYLFQPLLRLSLLLAYATLPGSAPFIMVLWILIVLLLLIGIAAFFTTYQTITWTLLFMRLTERGATPKLIRLFHKK